MTKHKNQDAVAAQWPPESTCFFPRLNDPDQVATTTKSVAVEMPSALLNDHLQAEKIPLWLFLSSAWAVTLRCFTECEHVHLWVAEGPAHRYGTVELLNTPIDAQTTMRALCKSHRWTRVHQPGPGDLSNVGIVFEEPQPGENGDRMSSSTTLPIGCDLVLCVEGYNKHSGQPLVSLHYRDFLLSPAAATNLADTVQQVISSVLSRMDDPIGSLQLCSPAQYAQIERWSSEDHPVKEQQRVTSHLPWWHGLCHQARLRPGQMAIEAWDGQWTYRQLDEISSRVAAQLQAKGIGPGMMIPVCYEKSVWAIAAAIGVHKTGAAFVPLDPSLPSNRVQAILESVEAQWVVTSCQQNALFEKKHETQVTVMLIDAGTADSLPSPAKWTSPPSSAQDPAYCLFTSGSTGRPKGCVVSHGAFAGIAAHAEALRLNDSSRSLQFASLAFGMSIIEIYCTLAAGGTICLLSDSDRASLRTLTLAINRMRVTWAIMTPTMIGSLLPAEVPCLRTVLTGGEPLHKSQLLAWADAVHLHQVFGFTEWAGICCVSSRITSPADRATIGRPVPNARVWLVDPDNHTRLAPIGAVAELCIEGTCLAQGYLHDSARTSYVFVPRPDWDIGGEDESSRMYRTGDLVRYTCDGQLMYLGRKDTQRKIRGQRVELAEVEYHLRERFPDAQKVLAEVITPRGGDDESQQVLAAFVLPQAGEKEEEETALKDNRRWFAPVDASFEAQAHAALDTLRARLPRYMVPDLVLRVREVPLTISGKLDRRRLCTDANRLTRVQLLGKKDLCRGPSTDTGAERPLLLQLVLRALNLPPGAAVGMDDNFFHLGGDSIKAMKLVGLAHPKGLPLTVLLIFKHPVLSDLQAALLTERDNTMMAQPDDGPTKIVETAAVPPPSSELVRIVSQQYALAEEQITDVYPCSPMQEGMMALSMKSPGAYLVRLTLTLRPEVDVPRLCAAWEAVMQRNEIFRTRIIQTDAHQMLQVVMKEPPQWETCATEDELGKRVQHIRMGLGDALLYSAIITNRAGSTQPPSLAIVLHHSICDRWSLALAREQLDASYAGLPLDQQNKKKLCFRDFITHIRAVQGADEFWQAQFAGLTLQPFPALPPPTYEPSRDSDRKLEITIPSLSCAANYTLSTAIQLAWAVVVSRYTNSSDVVYGLTVTGRAASLAGIESIVGPTVATVPLRIQLSEDQAVEEALTALQLQVTDMAAYEQTGLQHIRTLGPDAEAACQFQNQLVIQFPADTQQSESSPSVIAAYDEAAAQAGGFASYPLLVTCQLSADPHTITVTADFDSKLIPAWKVERVLWTLETTLGALIQQPHRPLRDLPALSTRDQQQLLEWAPTPPPEDARCLNRVIQQNVLERPSSEAVCAWDGRLSYSELWQLSGYLARYLRQQHGVGPEVVVPLLFEKSQWLPVSMLAVMRAGGAYTLLDPLHPLSRLREICEAVESPFVVASQALTELGQQLGCCDQVVTVAPGCVALSPSYSLSDNNDEDQEICPEVQPNNTVYVVFTSGSTGKPKGVVIEHRTYCSTARAHIPGYLMSRTSRVLQWAACAFDVCCIENLSTLLCGGCICIPQDTRNVDRCVAAMNELEVTLAIMTPSFARALQHQGDPQTLQTLLLVGEAASEADIRQWPLRVRLLNSYGPAECSAVTTVQSDMRTASSPANIGFPTNARCWLVHPDDPNRPVPIGAVGELLIEGPLVGRGYLNDPVKTKGAFLEPPQWLIQGFAGLPHRRLYRTGDLMCLESDGSLCFVGRKDFQIKLRGQRMELGEIEKQVQRCLQDPLDVVTELITPVDRSPLIVAFIWEADDPDGELPSPAIPTMFKPPSDSFRQKATALDSHLRQVLPGSMVPSLFLPVRSMPRAQTGKTDRRLLRQTAAGAFEELLRHYRLSRLEKDRRAPTTELECILHGIWVKVLKLPEESIGLDDNFFHLGGDSISAMFMVAEGRRQHGLAVSMADLFAHPTLGEFAAATAQHGTSLGPAAEDETAEVVLPFSLIPASDDKEALLETARVQCQVRENEVEDIYPCTPLQEGMFVLGANQPGGYVARWVFEFPAAACAGAPVDVDALQRAWTTVAQHHSILRTRIILSASQRMYQVVLREPPAWHYSDTLLRVRPGHDDGTKADLPVHFGLPLIKLTRHQEHNQPGAVQLAVTMHHALYDGWSFGQILQQVEAVYHGHKIPAAIPYNRFVRYLLQGTASTADTEKFWKDQFAGLQAEVFPSVLPASQRPSPTTSAKMSMHPAEFAPGRFTRATVLRLAWALVQSQYQGNQDVVFGVVTNGRSAAVAGIESITGPTLATIPWRTQIDPATKAQDALGRIQERAAEGIAHEQVGLQNLRQLGPEAAEACAFQALLVVQQQSQPQAGGGYQLLGAEAQSSSWTAFGTYALTLLCTLEADPIELEAWYDPQLVSDREVHRMLRQLKHVVGTLCANDPSKVTLLDTMALSPGDWEELCRWNTLPPSCPADEDTVTKLWHRRCVEHPDRLAVDAWDGQFTYGMVDTLSADLARHLVNRDVRPGDWVGICLEKSRWTVVAMLAVAKSGAAFILLDRSHPRHRLQLQRRQARCTLVITSMQTVQVGLELGPELVVVGFGSGAQHKLDAALPAVRSDRPLFAVFTSGSTGEPKAAIMSHSSFLATARPIMERVRIDETVRWLQFAAYAFDMSVIETFWTLLGGGCLCILSEQQRLNGFIDAASAFRPTHAFLTPTFACTLDPAALPSLRALMLGGEVMQACDVARWGPRVQLMNIYGPAECGVTHVHYFPFPFPLDGSSMAPPNTVGFPTGGGSWLVSPEDHHRLVPIGAVGELLLEDPMVGPGYLNNAVETEKVFLSAPAFVTEARGPEGRNRRVYRSGDLMRYNLDGSLVYIGRKDSQVKLRGQRIELGEVETHVQSVLGHEASVIVELVTPNQDPDNTFLVAFVHCMNEEDAGEGSLTTATSEIIGSPTADFQSQVTAAIVKLQDRIPRFMIPTLFLRLTRLPRTMTGKADRRQLRAAVAEMRKTDLDRFRISHVADKRPPSGPVESTLQSLCARVLRLAPAEIGLDDNFFHLGGDSISAMHLAAAARAQGLAMTVSDILESPRLSSLASRIAVEPVGTKDDTCYPSIAPFSLVTDATRTQVACQLVETGLVAQESQIADILPVTEGQSFFLTQWTPVHHCNFIRGPVDVDRLRDACEAAVARHSILRTVFVQADDMIFQAVMQSIKLPFHTKTTEKDLSVYCDSVWECDCAIGSTVNQAPLRFTLVSQSPTRHVFIIRLSHAQYDGVSMPVLLNDLSMAYSGAPLSQTLDFCSYMHYRSHHDHGPAYSFWRNYLRHATVQRLPFSASSSPLPPASSANSPSSTARIATAHNIPMPNPPPGITTANLVKAATAWVMHRHGSPTDLILGQTVTGRSMPLPGIDTVLGACLNFIPFRVTLERAWTVMDLLKHVQQQSSSTLGYDFMDFSDIVRHSTDWPQGTQLPCVIQHQNVDQAPKLVLHDAETTTSAWAHFIPPSGLWIMSTPQGSSLQVVVCTSEQVMSRSTAKELVDEICEVLAVFASGPGRKLDSLRG